mgnify:CR=1 FL=1
MALKVVTMAEMRLEVLLEADLEFAHLRDVADDDHGSAHLAAAISPGPAFVVALRVAAVDGARVRRRDCARGQGATGQARVDEQGAGRVAAAQAVHSAGGAGRDPAGG